MPQPSKLPLHSLSIVSLFWWRQVSYLHHLDDNDTVVLTALTMKIALNIFAMKVMMVTVLPITAGLRQLPCHPHEGICRWSGNSAPGFEA